MHHEKIEAEPREHRLDHDLARAEPILLLAAVEHELQAADAEAEHEEAGPVEGQFGVAPRVGKEEREAGDGEHADRQVDVEDLTPIVGVGEIAAERWAKNGADHHAHAP